MPRIIVMSDPSIEREGRSHSTSVTSANLRNGHDSAQLIERVGWAVHDADEVEREQGG